MDREPIGMLQGMKVKRNEILEQKASERVTLRQKARVIGLDAMNVHRA